MAHDDEPERDRQAPEIAAPDAVPPGARALGPGGSPATAGSLPSPGWVRLGIAEGELAVLRVPLAPVLPDGLSSAEREVALAILRGEPNAAIARRRGTSERTVANQVASLFRKLKVTSRAELAARLAAAALEAGP